MGFISSPAGERQCDEDEQNEAESQIREHRASFEQISLFAQEVPDSCQPNEETTDDCARHNPIAIQKRAHSEYAHREVCKAQFLHEN